MSAGLGVSGGGDWLAPGACRPPVHWWAKMGCQDRGDERLGGWRGGEVLGAWRVRWRGVRDGAGGCVRARGAGKSWGRCRGPPFPRPPARWRRRPRHRRRSSLAPAVPGSRGEGGKEGRPAGLAGGLGLAAAALPPSPRGRAPGSGCRTRRCRRQDASRARLPRPLPPRRPRPPAAAARAAALRPG